MNKILSLLIIFSVASAYGQDVKTKKLPTSDSQSATSQSAAPIKLDRTKATNRIKLQFDEDLVKGSAENTELNFIQTRKENSFKKMIKIRENFIPEIESSSSELGSK